MSPQSRTPHSSQKRHDAVVEARQFVYNNSFGTLTTVNQGAGLFEGFPTGQVEYYSDNAEDDASLLLIWVDMSTAFRNIHRGSLASLVIRTGDVVGGVTPPSVAAQPRIVIYGEVEPFEPSAKAKSRFFQLHPDARAWEPGQDGFHKAQWVKFAITGLYYIGGFGDKHYIGTLPVEEYIPLKPQDPPSKGVLSSLLRW